MGEDSRLTNIDAGAIVSAINPGRPGSIDLCGICSRAGRCHRRRTRRACSFPAWAVAAALARWDREREREEGR